MDKEISRRNFLKVLGIGAGTAAGLLSGLDRFLPDKYRVLEREAREEDTVSDETDENTNEALDRLSGSFSLDMREEDPEDPEEGDMWFRSDI
jgi:hypothetical protein